MVLKTFGGSDKLNAMGPISAIDLSKTQLEFKICDVTKKICSNPRYIESNKLLQGRE